MGMQYIAARDGVAAAAVLLSLTAQTDELYGVKQISVTGEAVASAVNRMALRRSTTNGVTPTAQTPAKRSPTSPASYSAVATAWTTPPTQAAAPALWTEALNAFGGVLRWQAVDPDDYIIGEGGTAGNNEMTLGAPSGTATVSCQLVFEDL